MTRRHTLLTALAGIHLALVVCGAASWSLLPDTTWVGQALHAGRSLTGSDNGFGFYAPEVGAELRARFTLSAGQRRWTDTLDPTGNREAQLRLGTVISLVTFPDLREPVIASLAAAMLGRHPSAQQVIVCIEVYDPPTMEEYRAGARPEWQVLYEAVFTRQPQPLSPTER